MPRRHLFLALAPVLATFLAVLPAPSLALADSLTDTLGARAVGQGEAVRASAWGASAPHVNPAGAALSKLYAIEGSFGLRQGQDAFFAGGTVCDSVTSPLAACLAYTYFDTDGQRTLHDVGLALALPIIPEHAYLGLTGHYVDYTVDPSVPPPDADRDGAVIVDAGLIVKIIPELALAATAHNLIGSDSGYFPRGLGGGVALSLGQLLTLGGDALWNLDDPSGDTTGRFGVGGELFLSADEGQQGYPIRLGYVFDQGPDAHFLTGGLGFATPRFALEGAIRQQVGRGGDERQLVFSLRMVMPS